MNTNFFLSKIRFITANFPTLHLLCTTHNKHKGISMHSSSFWKHLTNALLRVRVEFSGSSPSASLTSGFSYKHIFHCLASVSSWPTKVPSKETQQHPRFCIASKISRNWCAMFPSFFQILDLNLLASLILPSGPIFPNFLGPFSLALHPMRISFFLKDVEMGKGRSRNLRKSLHYIYLELCFLLDDDFACMSGDIWQCAHWP